MADEAPQGPQTPQEQLAAGQEVAAAGAQAAAAESEPGRRKPAARRAIQSKAAEKGWELSDDDAGRIADMVVDRIRDAGGFDRPPEPLATPPAPAPAPVQAAEQAPEAPHKRSFAEVFRQGR